MASFPNLKTGAVAQYPATRVLDFDNRALRFVDGSEQRYRYSAGPLRQWGIKLDFLDEGEMAALEEFFLSNRGSFEDFEFVDPWDEQSYPHCSLEADGLEVAAISEMWSATSLTVVENRS
jgi:hypothetical protein